MTPQELVVLTSVVTSIIAGIIGLITIWITSRSKRAERKAEAEAKLEEKRGEVDASLAVTDRQEIYRLLGEQKVTIAAHSKEIERLRDMLDRTNAEMGRANVEIVRLNAVSLWYRSQLEKNHIPIEPFPRELMQRDFGQKVEALSS